MDEDIEPLFKGWRIDLSERGVEIRKKPGQLVHTYDKWMVLGVPTGLPIPVVERQLTMAFTEAEGRVRKDEHGLYDQRHHETKEPIRFSMVKSSPKECRGRHSKATKKGQTTAG